MPFSISVLLSSRETDIDHVVLFIKRLNIMLSHYCPDICPWADIAVALRCLRMGKIDVITYKYVINNSICKQIN